MTCTVLEALLEIHDLGPFLVGLRQTLPPGLARQRDVAELLTQHLHPCTTATVCRYEGGVNQIDSGVQKAYVDAFKLPPRLRLHLQELAGKAALEARQTTRATAGKAA